MTQRLGRACRCGVPLDAAPAWRAGVADCARRRDAADATCGPLPAGREAPGASPGRPLLVGLLGGAVVLPWVAPPQRAHPRRRGADRPRGLRLCLRFSRVARSPCPSGRLGPPIQLPGAAARRDPVAKTPPCPPRRNLANGGRGDFLPARRAHEVTRCGHAAMACGHGDQRQNPAETGDDDTSLAAGLHHRPRPRPSRHGRVVIALPAARADTPGDNLGAPGRAALRRRAGSGRRISTGGIRPARSGQRYCRPEAGGRCPP